MLEHTIYGCIVIMGLLLSLLIHSLLTLILIGLLCALLIIFCAEVLFV